MPSADSILVYKNIGYSYSWSNSREHSIARQFLESLVGKRAFIYSMRDFLASTHMRTQPLYNYCLSGYSSIKF